jgi:hypothetical protein
MGCPSEELFFVLLFFVRFVSCNFVFIRLCKDDFNYVGYVALNEMEKLYWMMSW